MIRALVLFFACIAVAGCTIVSSTHSATPVAVDAAAAVAQVNAFRARHGLGPVRLNDQLMRAAKAQAVAMASRNRMSHSVSWGDTLPRRLASAGYSWGAAAENIGAGYQTLEAAMAGWQASAGHRKNLLRDGVTEIGIAAAHAPSTGHGTFWALVLGGPPQRRMGGWSAAM